MPFLVVLLGLFVQRYLNFNSAPYHHNWVCVYHRWLTIKFSFLKELQGYAKLLIVVLPFILVVTILFAFVYKLLGSWTYWVLSLIWFWYCLEGSKLDVSPYADLSAQDMLLKCYHGVFAFIFWFVLFGPVGLALYLFIFQLTVAPDDDATFKSASERALQVLDWMPIKLLGLSFALVGSFAHVFWPWVKDLSHGLSDLKAQLTRWALFVTNSGNTQEDAQIDKSSLIGLLNRSIIIWLIVIALIYVGVIMG